MSPRTGFLGLVAVLALTGGCSKNDGDGSGGGVGKLTPQEHKNPRGTFTVKGPMPEKWQPRNDVMGGTYMALALMSDGMPDGQLAVGVDYVEPGETPESRARKRTAEKGTHPDADHVVVPPTEIEPGRWAWVIQNGSLQWRPGIYMFEANAVWKVSDTQLARCWVSWKAKTADSALDLCKQLEVTLTPPSP